MADDGIYTVGESVQLHADIYPGFVHPLPSGVPGTGTRKRVVVTERCLTIGWSAGGVVQRVDIEMTPEQTAGTTLRGGTAGEYEIGRDHGCGSCGSGAIKNWRPWPGIVYVDVPRMDRAAREIQRNSSYGLPSHRYTRSRP